MNARERAEVSLRPLKAIFEMKKKEVECQFTPYFYTYFKSIFQFPRRFEEYSKMCEYVLNTTRAKGRRVLDIGCGFGLISICLAIFGAHKVTGVDIDEEKISVFKKLLSRFDPPLDNVEAKHVDALKLSNEPFDIVIANEVVSHIRDLAFFLSRVNKALRKGGIFYISDGNNGLSILQRYQRRKIWRKAESGPVEGSRLELPYSEMRKRMIREKWPQIDENIMVVLVEETAGMWGWNIFKAVEEYLEKGRIAQKPSFKFRNPATGEYPEYEFNPYKLKKKLQRFGFKAKIMRPVFSCLALGVVRPSFLKTFPLNVGARLIILFHPISLAITPNFTIMAEKV